MRTVRSTRLTAFSGVEKGRYIYAFGQDLSWEAYMERLQHGFVVDEIIDAENFAHKR